MNGETMPEIWFPHLGIKINSLSRVAFTVFGQDVYWYGIFIALGMIAGLIYAMREAKRTGQNPDIYADLFIYLMIFSVIGARLYYVIFSWDYYSQDLTRIFAIREGGLAIYGGIIGGLITGFVFTKIKKLNFWVGADTIGPAVLLGQIIGRWGNFINREAFGGFTDNLFAMRYMTSQVSNVAAEVLDKAIVVNGVSYIQVHPTFLYESLWNLAVFIIIMLLKRKKKFDGQVFAMYIFGYALGRVWIEGLRTDQLLIAGTGIAVSQLLSAVLVVGSVIFMIYMKKRKDKLELNTKE